MSSRENARPTDNFNTSSGNQPHNNTDRTTEETAQKPNRIKTIITPTTLINDADDDDDSGDNDDSSLLKSAFKH
jgi:hypothetical protein